MGCSVSDHALEYVMYKPYTDAEIEAIFAKRFSGEAITTEEMNKFKTAFNRCHLLLFSGSAAGHLKRSCPLTFSFHCAIIIAA